MSLEKVLVINDDTDDIIALQARMPGNIAVTAASQAQMRFMDAVNADLVILDNDANNLQESKGAGTLEAIRKLNPGVPVVYTSFQPGWVPASVYQTRGVQVVRTDELPELLAKEFGLVMSPPAERQAQAAQTNIIVTYNPVRGYTAGVHGNGRLVIIGEDSFSGPRAKEVAAAQLKELFGTFDWRTDRNLIRNIFVYDGLNGGEIPGYSATALGHDVRMKTIVLACPCHWDRKERLRNNMYVDLYQVECKGDKTLGAVADVILGIKRPGIDYSNLRIPLEKITQEAEKFRL